MEYKVDLINQIHGIIKAHYDTPRRTREDAENALGMIEIACNESEERDDNQPAQA